MKLVLLGLIYLVAITCNRDPGLLCAPKVSGWSVGYCAPDESLDEIYGFHDMHPPKHIRWCRCFVKES